MGNYPLCKKTQQKIGDTRTMKYPIGLVVKTFPNPDMRCVTCDYKCGGRIGQICDAIDDRYEVNFGSGRCDFDESELTPMSKKWKEQ